MREKDLVAQNSLPIAMRGKMHIPWNTPYLKPVHRLPLIFVPGFLAHSALLSYHDSVSGLRLPVL